MSEPSWGADLFDSFQCQAPQKNPKSEEVQLEAAMQPGKPQKWLNALVGFARSCGCGYIGHDATNIAKVIRQQRWNIEKNSDNSPSTIELKHLVRLADSIMTYYGNCTLVEVPDGQSKEALDDFAYDRALRSVETLLYEDGRITSNERVVLNAMVALGSNTAQRDLYLLAAGYSANRDDVSPMKLPFDKHTLTLFRNKGSFVIDPKHPDQCQGERHYKALPATHPEVVKRQMGGVCYDFALSNSPTYGRRTDKDALDIVRAEYVPVPIQKESKVGDLVVYFDFVGTRRSPKLESPHMAVVSRVDRHGRPTHAISKFGDEGRVYEHPINEAGSVAGQFYGIFRRK